MANLVIDIGNSYIKTAVFNISEMTWFKSGATVNEEGIDDIISNFKPERVIISSVKEQTVEGWETYLSERIPVTRFNATMAKSIRNHYRTPQTLGLDRMAAVAGAYALYPDANNLIIDAGTCITYDWVDKGGNYFGGSISAGLNMRYKALNYYTAALPLIDADVNFEGQAGDDTVTAIRSGIQNGIKYEAAGFVESYLKDESPMNILLTGGDCFFFDTLLKNSIFAPLIKIEPHLVLSGLNAVIQQHND